MCVCVYVYVCVCEYVCAYIYIEKEKVINRKNVPLVKIVQTVRSKGFGGRARRQHTLYDFSCNLASELQDAIRCSDLKLTQLVLKRVREECTTKEQNEGSLVVAIEDAENLMRTLKSNETTRAVLSMLRSALQSQDMTMLGLALRRARKECTLKFSKCVLSKYLSYPIILSGTSEEQTQGPLSDAIQEAETQIRTYKTNERNRALITTLRNAIETQDIKLMELTLTRIRSECRCFFHQFFFLNE